LAAGVVLRLKSTRETAPEDLEGLYSAVAVMLKLKLILADLTEFEETYSAAEVILMSSSSNMTASEDLQYFRLAFAMDPRLSGIASPWSRSRAAIMSVRFGQSDCR
jgi:hypothetical protein